MKKSVLFLLITGIINCAYAQESNSQSLLKQTKSECKIDDKDSNCTNEKTHETVQDEMIIRAPIPVPVNGNTFYDRTDINRLPTRNGNITDLLKTNPAVRFNDASSSSLNQGTLDPKNISFHGSSPYQNLFLIDGMNATNRVNPADSNMADNGNNIMGNTQGYFLDVSLLESVRVYDSNVPVEYGEFNGGVIDAKLGRFTGDDKLKLSFRTTHSKWGKQFVKDSESKDFNAGGNGTTKNYTPRYSKYFYSISLDKQLTDNVGIIAGLSHRESRIVRAVNASGKKGKNTDDINTLLTKVSWHASNNITHDFTAKFNQANHEIQNNAGFFYGDSKRDMGSKAYGLAWQYEQLFDLGKLKFNLGWDRLESYTKPNSNSLITENPCVSISGITGRCTQGGQGHISQGTDTLSTKTRWDFDTFNTGDIKHDLYVGFDYSYIKGKTERHTEGESYQINTSTNAITSHNKYHTGKGSLSINHYTAYLSDTLSYERFSITPGIRYDYDSYLDNHNIAPRIRTELDLFADTNTIFTAGYNRYYGTSFIGSRLSDIRSNWKYDALTGLPKEKTTTNYKDLKTPYSDELTLGVQQKVADLLIGLNYVNRKARNQFNLYSRTAYGITHKTYNNNGQSETDSYNLSIKPIEPLKITMVEIMPQLVLSYKDTKGNLSLSKGYDDTEATDYDEVVYNGELMNYEDVPVRDYNTPWIVSMNLDFTVPDYGIIWANTVKYQSRQDSRIIARASDSCYNASYGSSYRQYCDVSLSSNFVWDTRVSWQPHFIRTQPLVVSVDILNVLNKKNTIPYNSKSAMTTSNGNLSSYGPGRQLWLQVDYTF